MSLLIHRTRTKERKGGNIEELINGNKSSVDEATRVHGRVGKRK